MRNERSNFGASDSQPTGRRCSGCGRTKPTTDFYCSGGGKLSSRCKDCQCQAARTTNRDRRNAMRVLIAAHNGEYRSLIAAERAKRLHHDEPTGGGWDVA